jgi:hypothetical protein
MTTQNEITAFVTRRFGPQLPLSQPWAGLGNQPLVPRPPTISAGDLAGFLLQDAEFRSLQLGTWLNSPDGELIAAAVEAALPPPLNREVRVIAEGMRLAAEAQRREGQQTAGALSLAVLCAGAAAMIATLLRRGS